MAKQKPLKLVIILTLLVLVVVLSRIWIISLKSSFTNRVDSFTGKRFGAVKILGDKDFVKCAGGHSHSLGLKSDGSISGWGDNRWGMADPPKSNDFVAIAAGAYHSLALKSEGSIVGWGHDIHGQVKPPEGNNFIKISARSTHSLALRSDGSLVAWGSNRFGNIDVPAGNDFVDISAGWFHSLSLKKDGSIVGWTKGSSDEATPPSGNDYIAIAAGGLHSMALKSDGSIVVWGGNAFGQMEVPEGNDFVSISAGYRHCLALRSDGSVVAWGNDHGGLTNSPAGNDYVAIAAGARHNLAVKSDGTIVGWGDGYALTQPVIPKTIQENQFPKQVAKVHTEQIKKVYPSSFKFLESPPKSIRLGIDVDFDIDLIYIKEGSFTMGRDVGLGEKLTAKAMPLNMGTPDEGPARKIKITKGFYIGKYKVTCKKYCMFLNDTGNPQEYVDLNNFARIEIKDGKYVPKQDCQRGAINIVHWSGADAYCKWLSSKTGLTVRLPTEAEWEFVACGPEGRTYPWGESTNVKWIEMPDTNYKKYPHPWSCAPVDAFPENVTPDRVIGMADLVGEWCSDFYGVRYIKKDLIDPKGPTVKDLESESLNPLGSNFHVFRGRGANNKNRNFGNKVQNAGIYGLRIVVEFKR